MTDDLAISILQRLSVIETKIETMEKHRSATDKGIVVLVSVAVAVVELCTELIRYLAGI